jgi:hypothetical protein
LINRDEATGVVISSSGSGSLIANRNRLSNVYSILTSGLATAAMLSAPNRRRRTVMPQILVVADASARDSAVVYRERISATDLESPHFSNQLVERVAWAVEDAYGFEREAVEADDREADDSLQPLEDGFPPARSAASNVAARRARSV